MAEFSVFYVCPTDAIPQTVRSAHGESGYPEAEWRWISGFHLAPLYAHLSGIPVADANRELAATIVDDDDNFGDPNDPDSWLSGYMVTRFPDRFIGALASLEGPARSRAARQWQSDLTAMKDALAPYCGELLDVLCGMAQKASSSGHCVILSESGG